MVERNTTTRDRHRKAIARTKPPCGICGEPIDYTLRYPDLLCYVVDHVIPMIHGGLDVIENKQAAHNTCNRQKSDSLETGVPSGPRVFVTSRSW